MFSGIIKHTGVIVALERAADGVRLTTESPLFADTADPLAIGESIAHSGVCLSVIRAEGNRAWFDVGSETLRRTTFDRAEPGMRLNLERSLRFGERVDGHFVQGHIEGVGTVQAIDCEGATSRIRISYPPALRGQLAPKGSIAVDGVSLTVGEIAKEYFSVFVVPITRSATTIERYQVGTPVNLETDCLARYVAAALTYLQESSCG